MKPYGKIVASSYVVKHTEKELDSLTGMIFALEAEVKVVMEATGGIIWTINNFQKENNCQKKSALKPYLLKRKLN